VDLTGARIALLLTGILAGVGYGQEPLSPGSAASSGASTVAPTKSPSAERVILKVGNAQVTQAEFEAGIGEFETEKEEPSDKGRRTLGDDYASVLMLSQQAVIDHLDSSPEVSRQLAIARMQVLSDAEFASLMRQADPTTDEISRYYSAHLSDYDRVQVHRLFIWKRGEGSKNTRGLSPADARARADTIRQAYAAGRDAKTIAEDLKVSGDGLLDPEPITFPRGELPPRMEKVAFALQEGEWSEVEDSPDALIFVQLVKRDRRQLGEVSSLIEKRLQGQKMQAMLNDLKKKVGIWMDEQYFGTAVAPVPGAQRRDSDPPSNLRKSARKEEGTNEDERQK